MCFTMKFDTIMRYSHFLTIEGNSYVACMLAKVNMVVPSSKKFSINDRGCSIDCASQEYY